MWSQISNNKKYSVLIGISMGVLFILFGAAVGYYLAADYCGELGAAVIGAFITAVIYFVMVCYAKYNLIEMLGENCVFICKYNKLEYPQLYNIVEEMCLASGLAVIPRIFIIDTNVPNAFAYGANLKNSSICVTRGLLELLDRDELQGVIAHEIAHIVNRDTTYLLRAGIVVSFISVVSMELLKYRRYNSSSKILSSSRDRTGIILLLLALVIIVLSPIISELFYMTLSRKREYLADACAVQFTRYPAGLANALEKICMNTQTVDAYDEKLNDPLINASLIVPFKDKRESKSLFATHPTTSSRINILLAMAGADYRAYNNAYTKITKRKGVIPSKDVKTCKEIKIKDIPLAPATALDVEIGKKIEKRREVGDMIWKHANYTFIQCECGTTLKLSDTYKGKEITCPHCLCKHIIPA